MAELTPISDHKKIKKHILMYLIMLGKGNDYYGIDLVKYVRQKIRSNRYEGTILRYHRELRKEGKIDFETIGQFKDSHYKLLKI